MKRILFILFILPEIFLPKLSHASVTCGVDRIPVAGCIFRNDNDPTYSFISITDGLTVENTDKDHANPIKPECLISEGGFMGVGSAKPSLNLRYFWAHENELFLSIYKRYEAYKRSESMQRLFNIRQISHNDHRKLYTATEKKVRLTESCRVGFGLVPK